MKQRIRIHNLNVDSVDKSRGVTVNIQYVAPHVICIISEVGKKDIGMAIDLDGQPPEQRVSYLSRFMKAMVSGVKHKTMHFQGVPKRD